MILEVNSLPPPRWRACGICLNSHSAAPPAHQRLTQPIERRIGEPYLRVDPKVIAVVPTHHGDPRLQRSPNRRCPTRSRHIIDFLAHGVKVGPYQGYAAALRSGVGNVVTRRAGGAAGRPFDDLLGFTEGAGRRG